MANTIKDTIATRKIAILASDGAEERSLEQVIRALTNAGAQAKIVAPHLGFLKASGGKEFLIECSLLTGSSVLFDAVYVPGGPDSVRALAMERDAADFLTEAYRHCKTIGATDEGIELLSAYRVAPVSAHDDETIASGVVLGAGGQMDSFVKKFIAAIQKHRHWQRKGKNQFKLSADGEETRGRQHVAAQMTRR
jgi:catalase